MKLMIVILAVLIFSFLNLAIGASDLSEVRVVKVEPATTPSEPAGIDQ